MYHMCIICDCNEPGSCTNPSYFRFPWQTEMMIVTRKRQMKLRGMAIVPAIGVQHAVSSPVMWWTVNQCQHLSSVLLRRELVSAVYSCLSCWPYQLCSLVSPTIRSLSVSLLIWPNLFLPVVICSSFELSICLSDRQRVSWIWIHHSL